MSERETSRDAFEGAEKQLAPAQVGDEWYVFREVTGSEVKRMEARCRDKRTNRLDTDSYLKVLCREIVLGKAKMDEDGKPTTEVIPGTKFDPKVELSRACVQMEEALTTFLGY
jgi:hypothetical protein